VLSSFDGHVQAMVEAQHMMFCSHWGMYESSWYGASYPNNLGQLVVHVTHSIVETPLNPFIDSDQSQWNNVNEVDNANTPRNEH
jgi:hypothetical protein